MEVAVWLSLVMACVVVGLAYGRFTPAGCCGCGSEPCGTSCSGCDSGTTYQAIAVAVSGVASGVNGNCTTCENADGTYITQCAWFANPCDWGIATFLDGTGDLGIVPICAFAPSDYGRLDNVAVYVNQPEPGGGSAAAGTVPVYVRLGMLTSFSGIQLGYTYYRTDVAESSPSSGTIHCRNDLDGLSISYSSEGGAITPSNFCDWSGVSVTLSV